MVFCPYCGNEIPYDANFCPFCGKKLNTSGSSPVRERMNPSGSISVQDRLNTPGSISVPDQLNTTDASPVPEPMNFADFIKEVEDRFPDRIIDLSQWDHARWDTFSGRYCEKYQCTLKDLLSDFKFTVKDSGQDSNSGQAGNSGKTGNSGKKNRKSLTDKEKTGQTEGSGYFASTEESIAYPTEDENPASADVPAEAQANTGRKKSGIGGRPPEADDRRL